MVGVVEVVEVGEVLGTVYSVRSDWASTAKLSSDSAFCVAWTATFRLFNLHPRIHPPVR